MKALVLILLATTSALAVTTVQFAKRASAEHERAEAERALRQDHEKRLRDLERMQSDLQQQLANARDRVETLTRVAQSASRALSAGVTGASGARAQSLEKVESQRAGLASRVVTNGPGQALAAPMPPPPFMRAQLRASTRRLYQDAGKFLGLTKEESEKLLDLLTEQQTSAIGRAPQDLAKNKAEIEALIGPGRMAQWEQYQKTLPERMQVSALSSQFEGAGMPLTDDQRTQLVNAMIETRQQLPPPPAAPGVLTEEAVSQHQQWQDEFNRLMTERARSILNSEQYEHYREYQEWQQQMRQFALRNLPRPAQPGASGPAQGFTFFSAAPVVVATDQGDSSGE